MEAQYRSINRGEGSIYHMVQEAGYNPSVERFYLWMSGDQLTLLVKITSQSARTFISAIPGDTADGKFWNLRSYDRINTPWQSIREMEERVSEILTHRVLSWATEPFPRGKMDS
jgi:phospholipase D1/2